jgi:hypothetical protein
VAYNFPSSGDLRHAGSLGWKRNKGYLMREKGVRAAVLNPFFLVWLKLDFGHGIDLVSLTFAAHDQRY